MNLSVTTKDLMKLYSPMQLMWNPLINPGTHDMMRVVIYFIMLQAGGTVLLKKGKYDLEYPSASVV